MRTIALVFAVCLSACAPKAIVVEPIAPQAVRVAEAVHATSRAARKADDAAKTTRTRTEETREAVGRGAEEADQMAKAGTATAEQLVENARRWREAWNASLIAVVESKALALDTAEAARISDMASIEAVTLEKAAVRTDKATGDLKTDLQKQAGNAELGKSLKRLIWIGIVIILLGALAMLFIKLAPLILKTVKPL